jgi:hypothetical protein
MVTLLSGRVIGMDHHLIEIVSKYYIVGVWVGGRGSRTTEGFDERFRRFGDREIMLVTVEPAVSPAADMVAGVLRNLAALGFDLQARPLSRIDDEVHVWDISKVDMEATPATLGARTYRKRPQLPL